MDDPRALTPIEREALRLAIEAVPEGARREALLRQMEALRVRAREYTGAGFFTNFDCPPALASDALPDESNHNPPEVALRYPDGEGALFFLVYVKDGVIDYLEGASSGMWEEESAAAGCWPGTNLPVTFDPALVKRVRPPDFP